MAAVEEESVLFQNHTNVNMRSDMIFQALPVATVVAGRVKVLEKVKFLVNLPVLTVAKIITSVIVLMILILKVRVVVSRKLKPLKLEAEVEAEAVVEAEADRCVMIPLMKVIL